MYEKRGKITIRKEGAIYFLSVLHNFFFLRSPSQFLKRQFKFHFVLCQCVCMYNKFCIHIGGEKEADDKYLDADVRQWKKSEKSAA